MLEFLDSIHPVILWVVFVTVSGFVSVVGLVLSFHWREYAIDSHKSMNMMKLYVGVVGILGAIMLITALLYQYGP